MSNLKPRKPDHIEADDVAAARQSAVRWLSRREYSVAEITGKLIQTGYDDTAVNETVAWLLEHGLVSDQRFAEAFTRMRLRRGYGPRRIVMELQQRGVSKALITETLKQSCNDWLEVARRAYRKRFGSSPCESLKEKSKRVRYLENRGFFQEQIQHVLSGYLDGEQ